MCQADRVYEKVINGELINSQGAYLGQQRLKETQMRKLSETFKIEFGQVYTRGKKKKGGGGFYILYSGTINTLSIPANQNEYLVCHTHPMGTESPSIFDIQYLVNSEKMGSIQRSSVIYPIDFPSFRFNKHTPYTK
jgi:hypothetical protein